MRRPWRWTAIILFTLALGFGGLVGDHLLALSGETRENLRAYTDLITTAHERYGSEVSFRDLVYASVQGMLRALDPHTSFLSPQAYSGMRERQQSSFYGLGILVGMRNNQLTVITPIDGTPASRLGIRAGDVISTIEGEPTDTMTLDEAVQKLKGPKDTTVHITITRRGLDEPLELDVTRAEIPQTTVRQSYMLEPGTGYLQISEFSRSTGGEVADALAKLKGQGMKRLVLDLRNNGGGLLDQAIEVSDQFLPDDSVIVETRGRTRDSHQTYRTTDRYAELGVPVVVLVNGGTASAAEILSGAIQDHDVGLIVGTPTWGKGLVQTVYSLSYGAGLALTTAKYYTPSGRLIQRDYTSFFEYQFGNNGPGAAEEEEPVPESGAAPVPDNGPVFETDLGREVYGGGGITPDVIIEADELAPFAIFLLARNSFFQFAVDQQNRQPVTSPDWQPPDDLLDRFKSWLIGDRIASAQEVEEGFTEEGVARFALLQIRAELMNAAFGQEAYSKVLARGDKQIQEALNLFSRAADLLERRAALDRAPLRQAAAEGARGEG